MKKLLFILAFIPFILNGQTPEPLVDLSEYHNSNRLWEMTDLNFYNITTGGYLIPALIATDATLYDLDVNGQISTYRVKQDSVWHLFGGFADSAVVIDLTEDEFSHVSNATNNLWNGIESDGLVASGDTTEFLYPGDYFGSYSVTFTGGTGTVFIFEVYNTVSDERTGFPVAATGDGTTDYVTVTKPLYFHDIEAGDKLVLRVTNNDNDSDITIRYGSYFISYLHD